MKPQLINNGPIERMHTLTQQVSHTLTESPLYRTIEYDNIIHLNPSISDSLVGAMPLGRSSKNMSQLKTRSGFLKLFLQSH